MRASSAPATYLPESRSWFNYHKLLDEDLAGRSAWLIDENGDKTKPWWVSPGPFIKDAYEGSDWLSDPNSRGRLFWDARRRSSSPDFSPDADSASGGETSSSSSGWSMYTTASSECHTNTANSSGSVMDVGLPDGRPREENRSLDSIILTQTHARLQGLGLDPLSNTIKADLHAPLPGPSATTLERLELELANVDSTLRDPDSIENKNLITKEALYLGLDKFLNKPESRGWSTTHVWDQTGYRSRIFRKYFWFSTVATADRHLTYGYIGARVLLACDWISKSSRPFAGVLSILEHVPVSPRRLLESFGIVDEEWFPLPDDDWVSQTPQVRPSLRIMNTYSGGVLYHEADDPSDSGRFFKRLCMAAAGLKEVDFDDFVNALYIGSSMFELPTQLVLDQSNLQSEVKDEINLSIGPISGDLHQDQSFTLADLHRANLYLPRYDNSDAWYT